MRTVATASALSDRSIKSRRSPIESPQPHAALLSGRTFLLIYPRWITHNTVPILIPRHAAPPLLESCWRPFAPDEEPAADELFFKGLTYQGFNPSPPDFAD